MSAADHILPQFTLQCGATVRDLRLRYEVHGELNAAGDNAVLFPTWFAGRHAANRWIIGPDRALDTHRYCIIVVNAIGNGASSSPSNHAGLPQEISLLDNVRAQASLVSALGVGRLHAIVGRSMGAQQALQWACMFPERVGRVFAFCGLPRTTAHNGLMLRSMIGVLEAGGRDAVALAAGIYAAWTLSHEFFNQQLWKGTASSEAEWIGRNVDAAFAQFDRRDLLCLARTWNSADISRNDRFKGDLVLALRSIAAPVFLMPISHDLIFPPRDFEEVAPRIANATSQTLHSEWGHRAAAPGGTAEDVRGFEQALAWFLAPPRTADDCFAAVSHFFRPT